MVSVTGDGTQWAASMPASGTLGTTPISFEPLELTVRDPDLVWAPSVAVTIS